MLVDFASLKPHSRLWIYHSKRKFTAAEKQIISANLSSFIGDWEAHGKPLVASFDIRMDQFIVLAVDEAAHGASGCSIDGSVRSMKMLGQQLGIDLFDRMWVSFVKATGLISLPLKDLKAAAAAGEWNEETPVVNTLVPTKGGLDSSFVVPAGTTWLRRYLPAAHVTG